MANVAEKFGLKPVRSLDGSDFINAQNRYRIASGYSTAIFQGDLVSPLLFIIIMMAPDYVAQKREVGICFWFCW